MYFADFLWRDSWSSQSWKPVNTSSGLLWIRLVCVYTETALSAHRVKLYWHRVAAAGCCCCCCGKDLIKKQNLEIQGVKAAVILCSPCQRSVWWWRRCWTYEVSESEHCWSAVCRASGPSSDLFPLAPKTGSRLYNNWQRELNFYWGYLRSE